MTAIGRFNVFSAKGHGQGGANYHGNPDSAVMRYGRINYNGPSENGFVPEPVRVLVENGVAKTPAGEELLRRYRSTGGAQQ